MARMHCLVKRKWRHGRFIVGRCEICTIYVVARILTSKLVLCQYQWSTAGEANLAYPELDCDPLVSDSQKCLECEARAKAGMRSIRENIWCEKLRFYVEVVYRRSVPAVQGVKFDRVAVRPSGCSWYEHRRGAVLVREIMLGFWGGVSFRKRGKSGQ